MTFADFDTCMKTQIQLRKRLALPQNVKEDRIFCKWFFEFIRLKEF